MRQNALTLLFVILTLWSCSDNSFDNSNDVNGETQESATVDFENFFDSIPTTDLPLTIKCGFKTTLYQKNFRDKYRNFIHKGFEVVGKIKTDNNQKLILFARVGDILYPYLFSLDENGNKIDSVYLHISTCAGDPNLELSTWSVIEKDLTINMTDTAKFFNYIETDSGYTRTLDSTIITKRMVELDNKGRFTKTNEEKNKQLPTIAIVH